MYCQFFGRYYYTAIYPGEFLQKSQISCRSLLLSTTVLNDIATVSVKDGESFDIENNTHMKFGT